MTAIQFLRQYKEADRVARRLKAEYERELDLIDAIKSTSDIDGMPHGNGITKKVEDRAVRLADKAAEWKIAELEALHQRQVVFDVVNKVEGVEGDILFMRYINLMTWREVCQTIPMAWSNVKRHHDKAVSELQNRQQQTTLF